MLKITNVHKSFRKNKILNGVDLTVNKGDVVVILGPSGSGKTTLLRTIAFLETADKGELEFDEIKTSLSNAHKKTILDVRKKIGFVYQNYNLFANKTALENVMEGLVIARKVPKKEAKTIAEDALKKVGLENRMDHKPSEMSGGQQQRVAIARAIAQAPPIILADEPTGNLDSGSSREIMQILKELHEEGRTVILITHDNGIAAQAKRIIKIMDGKIESDTK